jgi:hypothetical protein
MELYVEYNVRGAIHLISAYMLYIPCTERLSILSKLPLATCFGESELQPVCIGELIGTGECSKGKPGLPVGICWLDVSNCMSTGEGNCDVLPSPVSLSIDVSELGEGALQ